jgi:hypothetical protein
LVKVENITPKGNPREWVALTGKIDLWFFGVLSEEHDRATDYLNKLCARNPISQRLTCFVRTFRGCFQNFHFQKLTGIERVLECADERISDAVLTYLDNGFEGVRQ